VIFSRGQDVAIPCTIQAGALIDEFLVSIETEDGTLSGFADKADVRPDPKDPSRGRIRASVVEVGSDKIKVRIYGSFFRIASGTTVVSSDWANTHLQLESA
jgi:hypothetical protein